ncbi:carbohydrate ABC transporter permease [Spirochaeta thermophila]|nr:sugar ABC transporter permease [Spirochaeta thermophila]
MRRVQQDVLAAIGFLVIPFGLFVLFVFVPVFQAARYSVYSWNGLGPLTNYVGFKNFVNIFKDEVFRIALLNNIRVIILSLVIQLPLALVLAFLVEGLERGKILFRTIFFLPYIISEVIAGVIWSFIYNPQYGLPHTFLGEIFPAIKGIAFLGDPRYVFYAIFFVIVWKYFGLHMVIYIAGLQNIPQELKEAALIDGANSWQLNWHVILPLLLPTILISVFFSIIGSLQLFDIIWAMGKGDPVHAAETMVTYLYKFGFQRFKLGYGSAVALVIFFICLSFSIAYQRVILKAQRG